MITHLFHFTARHLLQPIQKEGIRRGATPIVGSYPGSTLLIYGTQWLTSNASFNQDWCDQETRTLPYDRTAIRLTIAIAKGDPALSRWKDWRKRWKKVIYPGLDDRRFCNPDDWWIYEGIILPSRIAAVAEKSAEAEVAA